MLLDLNHSTFTWNISLQLRHNERYGISNDLPLYCLHDDVIEWKPFPHYWPFVQGIHRSPVNSLHKGQWREALMFSLICVWINGWVNNREAGDLRRYRAHYDVTVMYSTVYSGTDQRKYQSSASLAFVRGSHRSPVNSLHKGPVTQKMFSFDDIIWG